MSCTLEQMADDVAALCGVLGIDGPIVFGHSAGGFVALRLAVRQPSLPAGLILCGTAPTVAPVPDDDPPAGLSERAGPEAAAVAERLFGGDLSRATGEEFNRRVMPFYAAPAHTDVPGRLMALTRLNLRLAAHFFSSLAPHYDLRPRLAEIGVPALVIVGTDDWVCPRAKSRALADGIPDAELVMLRGAGHFCFSEEPEPFLEAARAHIRRFGPRV